MPRQSSPSLSLPSLAGNSQLEEKRERRRARYSRDKGSETKIKASISSVQEELSRKRQACWGGSDAAR